MAEDKKPPVGKVVWADLTIPNAPEIRDFYQQVIGWGLEPVAMQDETGDYTDFGMKDGDGNAAAGVVNRRGENADLPPVWMIYVAVADVKASLEACQRLGGTVLKQAGGDDGSVYYAIIRDPAGAVMALMPQA